MFKIIKIKKSLQRNLVMLIISITIFYISTSYFNKHKTSLYLEKEILSSEMKISIKNYLSAINDSISTTIYKEFDYMPIWTKNYELTSIAKDFLYILKNHRYYGILNSSEYEYLISLFKKIETSKNKDNLIKNRIQFEIETTHRFLNFLNFLLYGNNKHQSIFSNDYLYPIVIRSIQQKKITNLPEHIFYKANKNIYYLQIGLKNFLDNLKVDTTKITSINDNEVSENNLFEYFKKTYGIDNINDSIFIDILKKYQKYTGLEETGKLDNKTIRLFKNSTFYLYCKIVLNLERFKNFNPVDSFLIWINIPSYNLKVIKNDSIIQEFKIIVGKKETPTPLFFSYIDKIIINPEWIVPPSIFEKEIINIIKKDKSYIKRNNFYIKDAPDTIDVHELLETNNKIRLAQKPGNKNALGKIKFCINNPYQIYIHDSPSKHLFKKETRAYSHGCIRIEKADEFAQTLLDYCQINDKNLKQLLNENTTKVIFLRKNIPVYITYFTCMADKHGNLRFYEDIYDVDDEKINALRNNYINFNIMN